MAAGDRPARLSSILHPRHPLHAIRVIAATLLLGLTALPIQRHRVSPLEVNVFHTINRLPGAFYEPLWLIMQLGNFLTIPLAALAALVTRRFRMSLDLAVSGTIAYLLALVVKANIVRPRPGALLDDIILRHSPLAGHGYTSGHAAVAWALATVASAYLPRWAQWTVFILAALVCIGRVYVGAHLPLDVVGGAALGWAVGSLVHLALGAPRRQPAGT